MNAQPANAYLRTKIMTASPEQLQLMLYDGAIRFATAAKEHMTAGRSEECHNLLLRAQKIVLEMISSLRPEVDEELCNKMSSLYNFVYRKLVDANVRKDPECVEDALVVLRIQRDTWKDLLARLQSERHPTGPAPDPAPQSSTFSITG